MAKPDAEEYARQVLYYVTALRSDIYEVKLLLCAVLANQTKSSPKDFENLCTARVEKMTDRLYRIALEQAKLDPPEEDQPPPFPDRGTNPTE
jgi:hypothetical protein